MHNAKLVRGTLRLSAFYVMIIKSAYNLFPQRMQGAAMVRNIVTGSPDLSRGAQTDAET